MIRANLLPKTNERIRAFGILLPLDTVRSVAASTAILLAVGTCTYGLESYRANDISARANADELLLQQHAGERARLRALSARVTELRELDLVARDASRSGTDAATRIARVGNALPGDVWLDEFEHNDQGYDVAGQSASLSAIGAAVVALGRAMPAQSALLLGMNGSVRGGLHFSARLQDRSSK